MLIKLDTVYQCDWSILAESLPKESVDLIYIDPPFNTGSDKHTKAGFKFSDSFESDDSFVLFLKQVCESLYTLLSPKGVFFLHLDWRFIHYLKVELDKIFGRDNFVNEIIWCYKAGGINKRALAKKHQTILFYAKDRDKYTFNPLEEKSYNRKMEPYHFKGVAEYCDSIGWYTLVKMKDWWFIDKPGRTSAKRAGYPTEKPEALLKRIITIASNEGDVVMDCFCGSGTTLVSAKELKRRFVGCDISSEAVALTNKRLGKVGQRIF